MADSSLSFHCIVCYDNFEHEHNYPVVLPCGHTFICNECAGRIHRCMECRTSLLYPLELDPAYREAVAAAKMEEAQERRLHRGVNTSKPNGKPKPINIKPEIRLRLPCPKNLVLLSLMEATIASSHSIDEGAPKDDDSSKQILAGVNIVTGGCGTYAVASKKGLKVYSDKLDMHNLDPRGDLAIALTESTDLGTEVTPSRTKSRRPEKDYAASPNPTIRKTKSIEIKTPVKQVYVHPRENHCNIAPPSPSLEQIFCTGLDNRDSGSTQRVEHAFSLKFGDHVQVVEIDADGWAKLARGRGYIYADHGTDLVKVGGPKDKACFVEGMMYSLLHRYMGLQNDQDDLHRMLEVLRKDLDNALWDEKDNTIVSSDQLLSVTSACSSMDEEDDSKSQRSRSSALPHLPNLDEEKETKIDPHMPVKPSMELKQAAQAFAQKTSKKSAEAGTFSLENLPIVGRFVCGNNARQQSSSSDSGSNSNSNAAPPSPRRTVVLDSGREDYISNHSIVNFRTGMSGHKGLSSHQTTSTREQYVAPSLHLMSVTNGIAQTKRRKNPLDARAMWEKEFQEALKFSHFPGVARRPTPTNKANAKPSATPSNKSKIAGPSIAMASCKENRPIRASSPRNENTVVRLPVNRAPGTGGTPKVANMAQSASQKKMRKFNE